MYGTPANEKQCKIMEDDMPYSIVNQKGIQAIILN